VVGTWESTAETLTVSVFAEAAPVDRDALEAEADRIGRLVGSALRLSLTRV